MEKKSADDLLEKEKKIDIHFRRSKRRNLSSSDEHSKNCKYKVFWVLILPLARVYSYLRSE